MRFEITGKGNILTKTFRMATKLVAVRANDAQMMFKGLNGVLLAYKPPFLPCLKVMETIILSLCKDLNSMETRPPKKYISIEGKTNETMKLIIRDSFADHPLVVGPRYQPNDFRLLPTRMTSLHVSGLLVCGINDGTKLVRQLKQSTSIRVYRVKGILGHATDSYFRTGRIVDKSTFAHVSRGHFDKICSSMQSSHQRKMFELCGVDIQSQAAYELALKGPIKPANPNIPMIYSIKCVGFSSPEFTLEITCTNENTMYLKTIIHDLGIQVRSNATCTQILCMRDGLFHLKDALLPKHWDVETVIRNIELCRQLMRQNEETLSPYKANLEQPASGATYVPLIERVRE